MKNEEELQRKIAWLESRLDQTESELSNLNNLLVNCGFPDGIRTLKATIEDLLAQMGDSFPIYPEDNNPPTSTINPFGI